MAIALEFLDLIVPRSIIEMKFPGGWDGCLEHHRDLIGGRVWFDDHLLRDGAMSPGVIRQLVEQWEMEWGFNAIGKDQDGNDVWDELCVVESMAGGATLPCEWLVVEDDVAYLRGSERGEVAGGS